MQTNVPVLPLLEHPIGETVDRKLSVVRQLGYFEGQLSGMRASLVPPEGPRTQHDRDVRSLKRQIAKLKKELED